MKCRIVHIECVRIPLAEAVVEASAFVALFEGLYERWEVAGSVRRRKPDVGDVEHGVISKVGTVRVPGEMWERGNVPLVHARMDALRVAGTLHKALYGESQATRYGERYRGVVFRGRRHEMFFADARNFAAQLVIRTGPAEFSERLVTQMKGRGIYRQHEGYVQSLRDGSIRSVRDERDYFELCGEKWKEPWERG